MRTRSASSFARYAIIALAALVVGFQVFVHAQDDPVVAKIIQLGKTDNQVMTWNDYASNRFGGRETGTNAYTDATQWAVWQFKQFGIDAQLEEVGEVPVGFNRGPWFGKMLKPTEQGAAVRHAVVHGRHQGRAARRRRHPQGRPVLDPGPQHDAREQSRRSGRPSQAAIAEVNANKAAFKGKWVLIAGDQQRVRARRPPGNARLRRGAADAAAHQGAVDAGALGTIQSAKPTTTTPSPTMAGQSGLPINILDGYVGVVGQAAGAARHQAARLAVQRDQGAGREEPAGRARVRHPQLVQDGADQVPQRRRDHQRLALTPTSTSSWAGTSTASAAPPAASTTATASPRAWRRCA